MNDRTAPQLTKWPFYLADIALLGLAVWLFTHYPHPLAPWAGGLIVACVAAAAFLALWPFRLEYDTKVRVFESDRLTTASAGLQNLEDLAGQIRQATGQWHGVQEHAGKTTQAAREIAERMTAEARAFSDFMSKASDSEKSTLRLEVEKLRRSEGQWLQVLVHTLDHVHALSQAGARSGQPNLAAQLAAFQNACRDLARRMGLVAIDAEPDQDFDAAQHEIVQGHNQPEGPAQIAQVIATGYSFQGQILRRPIVVLKEAATPAELPPSTEESLVGETPVTASSAEEFVTTAETATLEPTTTAEADPIELAEVEATEPEVGSDEFRLESEAVDGTENRRAGNA